MVTPPHALVSLLMWRDHNRDALAAFQPPVLERQLRLGRIARAAQLYRVARTLHHNADNKAGPPKDRLAHYAIPLDLLDGLPTDLPACGYRAAVGTAEARICARLRHEAFPFPRGGSSPTTVSCRRRLLR